MKYPGWVEEGENESADGPEKNSLTTTITTDNGMFPVSPYYSSVLARKTWRHYRLKYFRPRIFKFFYKFLQRSGLAKPETVTRNLLISSIRTDRIK